MNPALQLLTLPAARARIGGVERQRRAGLAADAGVAEIVQRQQRDAVLFRVAPHVLRRPRRERRDALDGPAAGEPERLAFLEIRARHRLIASKRRKPDVVSLEGGKERTHLVPRAARLGAFRLP